MNRLARFPRAAHIVVCVIVGTSGLVPFEAAQAEGPPGLYVSVHGDDQHDGSSPAKAFRTISQALTHARAGQTVYVGDGTYSEQVVTQRGGSPGAEITIKALGDNAVIDGSTLDWARAERQNQALFEVRHPYVRLVGMTIENSKNTGILLDADHITIEGCKVISTQLHAISTDTDRQFNRPNSSGVMIHDIVLKQNLVEKASLAGNSQAISLIADGFDVAGNTVRDSQREGIDIWLGARRGEVQGNTVFGNAAAGIFVDGASDVRIHHNVVYRNKSGIGVSSEDRHYTTHDVWVYDNVVYDNREGGVFLWDDKYRPGHNGVQDVLVAHNTIIGNRYSVYLAGVDNTAKIFNNLGLATDTNFQNDGTRASLTVKGNVWLTSDAGFVSSERRDFRLAGNSPAIDKGVALPPVKGSDGKPIGITTDFEGLSRVVGGKPDAGAYEYRGGPG